MDFTECLLRCIVTDVLIPRFRVYKTKYTYTEDSDPVMTTSRTMVNTVETVSGFPHISS